MLSGHIQSLDLAQRTMECQWIADSHFGKCLLTAKQISGKGMCVSENPDPVVIQEMLAASTGLCRGGRISGIWRWTHLGDEVQGRV